MTVVYRQGFDLYGNNNDVLRDVLGSSFIAVTTTGGRITINTSEQRSGTRCTEIADGSFIASVRELLPEVRKDFTIGFALKFTQLSRPTTAGAGFFGNNNDSILMCVNDTGNPVIYEDTNIVATIPTILQPNVYYYFEFYYNTSTGQCIARVDNQEVFNGVGPNTNADLNSIFIGGVNNRNNGGDTFIDDVYITRGLNFLGDVVISYQFPDGDGTLQQWANSAGTDGWPLIDDAPLNTATFISTSTINAVSDFECAPPANTVFQVHDVAVSYFAFRDAGTIEEIAPRIGHDGTFAQGTSQTVPQTTPALFTESFALNPATGVAWIPADVSALQIGFIKTT